MTDAVEFTVLLPVTRPPATLDFAIGSVLAQTEPRFELMVVCDGAPAETAECAREFAARDPRVRVHAFAKGERNGEAHRDTVLRQARGRHVAQIGDDDLWFPGYLAELGRLLRDVDFGNLPQPELKEDGGIFVHRGDLGLAYWRDRMLSEPFNFFGPTFAGYRLAAYRSLDIGWSPAPAGLPTDLHMWRKFLARSDLRFGTRMAIEGVKMSASLRAGMSLERRRLENARMLALVGDAGWRADFRAQALRRCCDWGAPSPGGRLRAWRSRLYSLMQGSRT